jgi:fibronectin type 3 domain-containing protein
MARDPRHSEWVAGGVHLVRAGLGVVGAAVLLWVSAVVMAGSSAAAATNLIGNGSFESGGSYSFAGWKTQNATQAGVASTAPGGGSFATAVSYSGAGASFQIFANPRPVLDTVGGTTYTATAWVKGAKKVCLTIKETTSLGAAVASSTPACATAAAGAAVTASYTVAADHDQLGVVISQPAAAVTGDGFQADTVTLTPGQDLTAPTVPGALRVTSNTSTAVALAWDASTDPDDSASAITYHLYRDSVKIADIPGPATTYSDTNVTAGASYAYTIEATDAAGNSSGVSAPLMVTAGDTTKPTIPANLAQTGATATTISIAWDPSTDPDDATTALRYHVYRGTTLIATVATTGYTDTGRTAATSYGYRVDAFDPAGNTSAQSPSLTASTDADMTAPTVPANVAASALDTSRIKITWTKSTDPDNAQTSLKYLVFRDGAATPIATVTTNTFTDTGLLQGTTHAYTVAGIDPAGNTSAQSSPASATTKSGDTTAPTVPTGLALTGNSTSSVSIRWNASSDPDNPATAITYNVYRNGAPVGAVTGATSFTDTGLAAGSSFTYTVGAVDPALNASARSSALAGFTQALTHTVSQWHMDETSGTVAQDTVGANNGSLQAVVVNQPGYLGTSYTFTGSTNKSAMTVPDAASLNPGTANITVTIHVQFTQLPTPGSGDYDILRKGAATINGQRGTEYKLELLPTGQAYCELRGTIGTVKLTGATNLADGAWHTIICSRTGIGSMSLTVDGATLTANASTSIGSIASSLPFFVGGSLNPVQDFYRGQIDEVTYASG